MNYYNDNDPFCCKWLAELMADGLIPKGDIDDRDIREIQPSDLRGYTQCHFFAGTGGWSLALEIAGWPTDKPIWTGSCPCQSLSCAGLGLGYRDERHLWPEFHRLISECRPVTVCGEQVASKDGREWCDGVCLDLEELDYAVWPVVISSASVGSPNIRKRLWWVAYSERNGRRSWGTKCERFIGGTSLDSTSPACRVAYAEPQHDGGRPSGKGRRVEPSDCRNRNFWSDSILIPCRDGKFRRVPGRRVADAPSVGRQSIQGAEYEGVFSEVERQTEQWEQLSDNGTVRADENYQLEIEPALFPLASGLPNRVGLLRGAGNSINPWVAAEFIKSFKGGKYGN